MNSLMWPWPERMVSWLRPTRLTCFAVVTNKHPPPISYQESLTKAGQWVTDKAKQWSHFNPINQMPAINITSSSSSPLIYCAEGGHWIFEWNVHSLSYFIEYGQISKWEKHWGLWTNQRKTETNCNILHIYESWHVHDSSHIVFGLSKPCKDI